ncbi:MAG: EpsG family protein [Thomasclavelia sp.]|uniref:EpsG family protein n=1 Tax=Thomasclavelia sp. TaxID=3025757 RepID=UPI0039A18170
MIFWIGMFILTLFCYGICSQRYRLKIEKKIVIIYSAVLIFFAGMRSGIGDTGFYLSWFNKFKSLPIGNLFGTDIKEVGYAFIMSSVGKFTQDPQIYLIFIAIITIGGVFYVINKYSEDISISLLLFMTSGLYLGMMNGIRQYIVVVGLFLLTNCLIKNKPIIYICVALILSTVHTSALFMIPIFFIVRRKVWKSGTIVLIGIVSFALFNINSVLPWIAQLLQKTAYENYSDSLLTDIGSGANYLRVIVMLVPVFISFLGKKIFDENDMEYRVYSNIMILNAICYLFSARNWIFARLAMYLHIYIILFYPYVLSKVFTKDSIKIVKILLIVLYSIFFLFEVKNTPYMSYYLNINTDLIGEFTRGVYSGYW